MSSLDSNLPTADESRAPPRALIKPLLILVIAVAVVLGGIYAWQRFVATQFIGPMLKAMATAPQTVSTMTAVKASWQSRSEALGTVRAVRGADLSAQASGVVDTLHIDSGTDVRAGTVLLTLKPNDDPAKLAQLEAQAEIDAVTLKRDQEQLAAQAVSQATVDVDTANLKSARAQVAAQKALIEEKTVRAPFSGRLGLRQVDEGQYLAAGTTIVTLQALDPIYIDFYVPQQALARLKVNQSVGATIDAYPGVRFAGKVTSISSKVDSASRNVQIRGSFANADRRLVPGMYANVEVDNDEASDFVTIPQSAVSHNPYGDTVYLIQRGGDQQHPALTVLQRFVKLGDTRGDQVAVLSGVEPGDEVVTAGQLKLRNGAAVLIDNKVMPGNAPNPTPPNE